MAPNHNSDLETFRETSKQVNSMEGQLHAHEVQCEERWRNCFDRLGKLETSLARIESRMLLVSGSLIMFLAGLTVTLATKL